ncbi:tellurite resistance TerB family protein [Reichenbachiella versicolor]|uniref:tellurite resistance TerB family protein n=1 Tax=Reichenbachiella versicolor TaxID=1821036 RepID=UPI000D6EA07D|nr:TerB family tellurite resistance protein [Reichenbachiella versicolor]
MVRQQLSALAQLAKSDDKIDEAELNVIFRVGRANHLDDKEIQEIIDHPGSIGDLNSLSEDEKFEFLFSVIQLMKADDEIFNAEIDYCNQIAVKLGYGMGAVMEMYPHVHKNLVIKREKDSLRKKVRIFLKG